MHNNQEDNENTASPQVTAVTTTKISFPTVPNSSPVQSDDGVKAICAILGLIIAGLGLWHQVDPVHFRDFFTKRQQTFPNSTPTPVPQSSKKTISTAPVTRGVSSSIGYVIVDQVYIHISPNESSRASYILPRGTRVEWIGESYRESNGVFWVKVQIQTGEGAQTGWVKRSYIS